MHISVSHRVLILMAFLSLFLVHEEDSFCCCYCTEKRLVLKPCTQMSLRAYYTSSLCRSRNTYFSCKCMFLVKGCIKKYTRDIGEDICLLSKNSFRKALQAKFLVAKAKDRENYISSYFIYMCFACFL